MCWYVEAEQARELSQRGAQDLQKAKQRFFSRGGIGHTWSCSELWPLLRNRSWGVPGIEIWSAACKVSSLLLILCLWPCFGVLFVGVGNASGSIQGSLLAGLRGPFKVLGSKLN